MPPPRGPHGGEPQTAAAAIDAGLLSEDDDMDQRNEIEALRYILTEDEFSVVRRGDLALADPAKGAAAVDGGAVPPPPHNARQTSDEIDAIAEAVPRRLRLCVHPDVANAGAGIADAAAEAAGVDLRRSWWWGRQERQSALRL